MRRELPAGTVTLVFTDIEGSTALLNELGADRYAELLEEHRRSLRDIVSRHQGVEVDTQGDAFFLAFAEASGAVDAAVALQAALADGRLKVRIGIHSGAPRLSAEGYVGPDVHLAARLCAAGHGGQVLLSAAVQSRIKAELTDLGEHRLKDFSQPVAIYQLGADTFPPLRTISNTNLPRPASSFVGRQREMADIGTLLADGARLVVLTGPGGTGKTRLAIEAAAELVGSFRAGIFWVPLAPLRDAALVTDTVTSAIGAKGDLVDHIGARQMLLVLDNLEHLVAAAADVAALVEACPALRVLATSRERLRVRGEHAYPVEPLSEPSAVELFCQRAGLPADAHIERLCTALENLPLAIELAAARTSILSPAEIADRLVDRLDLLKGGRDADPRQQTLRAMIEWSHDLLTDAERGIFRRLSVFRGGCTLRAAQQVTGADLDTMGSLVDKSLLRRADDRFLMLETVREYAAERLHAAGEWQALSEQHLNYYVELANQAFEAEAEYDLLPDETDNLRAAADWAQASDFHRHAVSLLGAVAHYWMQTGRGTEARTRLASALEQHVAPDAERVRARPTWASSSWSTGTTRRRWSTSARQYTQLQPPATLLAEHRRSI